MNQRCSCLVLFRIKPYYIVSPAVYLPAAVLPEASPSLSTGMYQLGPWGAHHRISTCTCCWHHDSAWKSLPSIWFRAHGCMAFSGSLRRREHRLNVQRRVSGDGCVRTRDLLRVIQNASLSHRSWHPNSSHPLPHFVPPAAQCVFLLSSYPLGLLCWPRPAQLLQSATPARYRAGVTLAGASTPSLCASLARHVARDAPY
jgi:hypothetical protein